MLRNFFAPKLILEVLGSIDYFVAFDTQFSQYFQLSLDGTSP